MANDLWRIDDDTSKELLRPVHQNAKDAIYRPELLDTIEAEVDALSADLRTLSLEIHDHPELKFEERFAHVTLTAFLRKQGFQVTPHYYLSTAWLATFEHTSASSHNKGKIRTIGVNSEMDALPDIGHGCGHNLIAIAGVAIACAVKAVLKKWDISGKIELLGTPGEEGGQGKIILLEHGAYKNMDVCLMCHPAPAPRGSVSLSGSLALERLSVEYSGHAAHAGLSPWEGQNALDACVLAYNNISLLRQQIRPTHRVHGIFKGPGPGHEWAVNIIPDHATMDWIVRAPTRAEAQETRKRVIACFEAAALASACTVKINSIGAMTDLRQNKALGDELATIVKSRYGSIDYEWGIAGASTDFGNVTYGCLTNENPALPSIHPGFSIPIKPNGGNHTREFAESARTVAAHNACLTVSKALAATAVRVLCDDGFFEKVLESFKQDVKTREHI